MKTIINNFGVIFQFIGIAIIVFYFAKMAYSLIRR